MSPRAIASISFLILLSFMLPAGAEAQWIEDGNPIIIHSDSQTSSVIVHDGSGGAYIAWLDYRNVGDDIYIQHLDRHINAMLRASGACNDRGQHFRLNTR